MDVFELIKEGKISRYFRSRQKLVQAGLISHITQRAAGKDVLFIDDDDYRTMMGLMKEISAKYEVSVFAFCLLPNHIHLLLRPAKDNLHFFVRDLCGRYATRFNKRYERRGHLFGGSFRQSVVLNERYLLAVSFYIHLNPVRAGLTNDPCEYRYSSCRHYTQERRSRSFINTECVLSLITDQKSEQRRKYSEILDLGKGVDSGNVLEDERSVERFLMLLKEMGSSIASIFGKKSGASSSQVESLEEGVVEFDKHRGLRKPESMKAKKYLVQQLLARGYTITQISDRIGISRKTAYNLLAYVA
jgi:putative transposase